MLNVILTMVNKTYLVLIYFHVLVYYLCMCFFIFIFITLRTKTYLVFSWFFIFHFFNYIILLTIFWELSLIIFN